MITEIAAITVKQLNFYVKSLLEGDSHLQSVTVTGELSNFKTTMPAVIGISP
ncbi:MAG: exodeoxyribonuclease VII large subunit [Oscillospiraceae bacterium]